MWSKELNCDAKKSDDKHFFYFKLNFSFTIKFKKSLTLRRSTENTQMNISIYDQDRNLKIFLYKIIKRHQLGLQFLMLLWKKPWLYFKIKLLKRCDMLRNTYNFSSNNDFGFNSFSCGPKGFHTQTSLESRARFRPGLLLYCF